METWSRETTPPSPADPSTTSTTKPTTPVTELHPPQDTTHPLTTSPSKAIGLDQLAPVRTTDTRNAALNPVWGFDPLELLSKTQFPNDLYEYKLRHVKDARMIAVRRLPLEIMDDEQAFHTYKVTDEAIRRHHRLVSASDGEKDGGGDDVNNTGGKAGTGNVDGIGGGDAKHGGQKGGHHVQLLSVRGRSRQLSAMSTAVDGRLTPTGWSTSMGNAPRVSNDAGKADGVLLDESRPLDGTHAATRRMRTGVQPMIAPGLPPLPNTRRGSITGTTKPGVNHDTQTGSTRQNLVGSNTNLNTHARTGVPDTSTTRRRGSIASGIIGISLSKQPKQTVTTPTNNPTPNFQPMIESTHANMSHLDHIRISHLARSAAAIVIQSAYRGFHTRRRFMAIAHAKLSVVSVGSGVGSFIGLPCVDNLSVQERLWLRYQRYCALYEIRLEPSPEFSQFCATLIQARWRCFIVRRAWMEIQNMTDDEQKSKAGLEARIRLVRQAYKVRSSDNIYLRSAECIQRAWRRFYNIRIFAFYRNLVKLGEQGDPHKLLFYINPQESRLLDKSMSAHVRFRLGGTKFPPNIYYKVYIHRNVVDLNAFSPRDYTGEGVKQRLPKQLFLKEFDLPVKVEADEWYQRFENNDWRPVSDITWKLHQTKTHSSITTTKPTQSFHYSKLKRHAQVIQHRKTRKLTWMKKMYRHGIESMRGEVVKKPDGCETHAGVIVREKSGLDTEISDRVQSGDVGVVDSNRVEKRDNDTTTTDTDKPFDTTQSSNNKIHSDQPVTTTHPQQQTITTTSTIDIIHRINNAQDETHITKLVHDMDVEFDPDYLIQWTRALDFDSYHHEWTVLATSAVIDDDATDAFVSAMSDLNRDQQIDTADQDAQYMYDQIHEIPPTPMMNTGLLMKRGVATAAETSHNPSGDHHGDGGYDDDMRDGVLGMGDHHGSVMSSMDMRRGSIGGTGVGNDRRLRAVYDDPVLDRAMRSGPGPWTGDGTL